MKLDPEWRRILRRAWSLRLMVLAALLTAAEVLLPYLGGYVHRGVFAALSAIVIAGAFVARLIAQRGLGNGDGD